MQQTNKYKLNLIEPDDPFLPDGLNANTQKIEDAMSAHEAKVDGQVSAIGTALNTALKNLGSGGKNARIVYGTYVGTGQYGQAYPNRLAFDFYPVVLFMTPLYDNAPVVIVRPQGSAGSNNELIGPMGVSWSGNEVSWYHTLSAMYQHNERQTYYYTALGYDLDS